MRKYRTIVASGLTMLAFAANASAEVAYGLTTNPGIGNQIIRFDTASPGSLIGSAAAVTGTTSGELLADIDVYPVTGQLNGIGATTGTIYVIDPITGVATISSTPSASVGTPQDADFNPSADRLRISSASNQNFRLTPGTFNNAGLTAGGVTADGTYAFAGGDVNAAATPNIVGNAYTNSVDGAATTSLYSIDTGLNALILHTGGPAFSTLNTVAGLTSGGSPLPVGSLVGFDVSPSGVAYLSDGNALYTLNLTTGEATSIGTIFAFAAVQTIAVPEPMSASLLAAGASLFLTGRRRRSM